MIYPGSKAKLARLFMPIILKGRKPNQSYVEPFCGGCNSLQYPANPRIAGDVCPYLIALWKHVVAGGDLPVLTKEECRKIKENRKEYPDWMVGHAGYVCSYRGMFFHLTRADVGKREGRPANYVKESIRNVKRQARLLRGVHFMNRSYDRLPIPDGSIVYCDPPYAGRWFYTDKESNFDHDRFWQWVRELSKRCRVFVSEYQAPSDFVPVWQKDIVIGVSVSRELAAVERLFVHESVADSFVKVVPRSGGRKGFSLASKKPLRHYVST